MITLNEAEKRELVWIMDNISELSLAIQFRSDLRTAKNKNIIAFPKEYSDGEKLAVTEAVRYFHELYRGLVEGYPCGNRSIASLKSKIYVLGGLLEKIGRSTAQSDT